MLPMTDMSYRLRKAREFAQFTSATEAARALGINASTYRAHENGQNDFGPTEAERYAKKFGVRASWLLTNEGPGPGDEKLTTPLKKSARLGNVPIKGVVKAGLWQDIDDWGAGQMDETVPSSSDYPLEWQQAYIVDGESLNRVAKSGDRLVCLDLVAAQMGVEHNDLVIVERSRFGGQMVERMAKRARKTIDGFELWPESDHPDHQAPIAYRNGNAETDEVRVTAKVLWILHRP